MENKQKLRFLGRQGEVGQRLENGMQFFQAVRVTNHQDFWEKENLTCANRRASHLSNC
jgi:hypothetical protein